MLGRLRKILSGGRLNAPSADELRDEFCRSEDWAVGDLAECIHGGSWWNSAGTLESGPSLGETHIVRKVLTGNPLGTSLAFTRWQPRHFHHIGFRKVTPKADAAERSESSFRDLVRRRSKPAAKPRKLKPAQREDA